MGRTIIAQQLGQQAGTDFPIMDDTDGYGGYRVVQDITARNNIPVNRRKSNMKVATIDDSKEWVLQPDLTSWMEASSSSGLATVADINELSNLDDTSFQDGYIAYVQTLKSIFTKRLQNIIGSNDVTHVDAFSGNSVWWRTAAEHSVWDSVTNWYIDSTNGDDEDTGLASNVPLKTLDEVSRRLNKKEDIFTSYTLHVGAGGATGNLITYVKLQVDGYVSNGASAGITAFIPSVAITNTRQLTTANIPWSNQKFYATSGSQNLIGYAISNPISGVSGETIFFTSSTGGPSSPIVGDTITELNFPTLNGTIEVRGTIGLTLSNLKIAPTSIGVISGNTGFISCDTCIFPDSSQLLLSIKGIEFDRCIIGSSMGNGGDINLSYVNSTIRNRFNSDVGTGIFVANVDKNCSLTGGGSFNVNTNSVVNVLHTLIIRDTENGAGIFYVNAGGIVNFTSDPVKNERVWGNNNINEIIIVVGGGQVYYSDIGIFIVTSVSSNWKTDQDESSGNWANLPYYDGNRFRGIVKNNGITAPIFVNNLAGLDAIDTSSLDAGVKVFVKTLLAHWTLVDGTVPGVANPFEARSAVGTPNKYWTRDVGGNPFWAAQDTIYLDGAKFGGDDENDGLTSGTALQTYDEYARRTFGLVIIQGVTINVTNQFIINIPMKPILDPNTTFTILGTTSVVGTGTVTAHVDFNSTTNTSQEVTATIAGNGIDTYPLAYVQRTNGGTLEGFVGSSVTSGTARLRTNSGVTPTNLSNGDTLSVEFLPTCDNPIIIDVGSENYNPITFNKINFTSTTECHKSIIFQTCTFTGQNGLTVHDSIQVFNCAFNCETYIYSGQLAGYAVFYTGHGIQFTGSGLLFLQDSLGQDDFQIYTNIRPNIGSVHLERFEISHHASNLDGPLSGVNKSLLDTIWGTDGVGPGNALITLEPGSTCLYKGTNTATVSGAFIAKLVVPGGTDITAATWADLPIVDTDTLSGVIRGI